MLNAISYTKGCYVGQETIARLKSVGHVNRTLVFLRGESAEFPTTGAKLMQGEKEVGTVTSSGFSPRLEKGIALGYVQRALADEAAGRWRGFDGGFGVSPDNLRPRRKCIWVAPTGPSDSAFCAALSATEIILRIRTRPPLGPAAATSEGFVVRK
jgi:hypothetical protein